MPGVNLVKLLLLPATIRHQVINYFRKRLFGSPVSRHEVIWTSFFYYISTNGLRILDETQKAYRVELENQQAVWIRKTPSSDVFVFFQLFIRNEYKPLLDLLTARGIRPANVLDAGANVGYFSVWFVRYFPSTNLISLEPVRSNYDQLLMNLEASRTGTTPVQGALWTQPARLRIVNRSAEDWSFALEETTDLAQQECRGVTLTELRMMAGADGLDVVKIDVEGAEAVLFKNADFLNELRRVKVLAMEIHDDSASRQSIEATLTELGFDFHQAGELTIAINTKR